MIRSVPIILMLCFALWSSRASADNDPYAALQTFTSITSKTINSAGCLVAASADVDGFYKQLDTFRNAWLNKDYSIDFYNQRRKQVFVHVIVKRYAELLTEGLYREAKPQNCSFSIVAKFNDKFGNPKEIVAATWKFDQNTNEKVNWDKIDPRDFAEIAVDFKISPAAMSWVSDEPSMIGNRDSKAHSDCQMEMLKANAIFIRAITYCSKNYMDRAGPANLNSSISGFSA